MYGDTLLLRDGVVSELDEFAYQRKGWTRSILEDHVHVCHAQGGKIRWAVEL